MAHSPSGEVKDVVVLCIAPRSGVGEGWGVAEGAGVKVGLGVFVGVGRKGVVVEVTNVVGICPSHVAEGVERKVVVEGSGPGHQSNMSSQSMCP
jgi:hypothetical protein